MGKSHGRILCKLSKSGILRLYSTSKAYPSKPKIDDVGSAKYYEKKKDRKMQSTFLVYKTVIE